MAIQHRWDICAGAHAKPAADGGCSVCIRKDVAINADGKVRVHKPGSPRIAAPKADSGLRVAGWVEVPEVGRRRIGQVVGIVPSQGHGHRNVAIRSEGEIIHRLPSQCRVIPAPA